MGYIPDLERWKCSPLEAGWNAQQARPDGALAIGWLDEHHPFPKGMVAPAELARILELCVHHPRNVMRGYHASPFADQAQRPYMVQREGRTHLLGNAEIWVTSPAGMTYFAPTLVYHYVRDCGYLPPREFLDAVVQFEPS